MKKIFIPILLLLSFVSLGQYNPLKHQPINKSIAPATPIPIDARMYYFDSTNFVYRPFVSPAEVLAYFPIVQNRVGNAPVFINTGGTIGPTGKLTGGVNDEWSFRDGTADVNLVKKNYYTTADSSAWYTAYRKRINGIVYDSASSNLTITLGDGTTFTNTINVAKSIGGGTNNYTTGVTYDGTTGILTTTRSGLPSIFTILPPALSLSQAGLVTITGTAPNLTITGNTPTFEQTVTQGNSFSKHDTLNTGIYNIVLNGTAGFKIVGGNTAQRPSSPSVGILRYNTDSAGVEFYNGSIWRVLGTGAGGGGGSGITALTGDATASGTGSVAITLSSVNSNVFGASTFLKFTVNAKGLITSATAIASSDIITALGYTPYNVTNPAGYQPISAKAAANGYAPLDATTRVPLVNQRPFIDTLYMLNDSIMRITIKGTPYNDTIRGIAKSLFFTIGNAGGGAGSVFLMYSNLAGDTAYIRAPDVGLFTKPMKNNDSSWRTDVDTTTGTGVRGWLTSIGIGAVSFTKTTGLTSWTLNQFLNGVAGASTIIDSANLTRSGVITAKTWGYIDSLHRGLISISGSGLTGTIATNQVIYGLTGSTVQSSSNYTYNGSKITFFSAAGGDMVHFIGTNTATNTFYLNNFTNTADISQFITNDLGTSSAEFLIGGSTSAQGTKFGDARANGFFLTAGGSTLTKFYLGTEDAHDVVLGTNGVKRFIVTSAGVIKLGTTSTTGYVWTATDNLGSGAWAVAGSAPVSSVFGRTGAVVAATNDYTVAQVNGAAPINNASFTGTFAFPSPFTLGATSVTTNGNQFNFLNAVTGTTGTTSSNLVFSASPTFSGTVTFPSPFTLGATSVTSTGTQLNYLNGATGITGSGNLVYSASPTFTGVPLGPTASAGTSTTQLATTAFVTTADNLKANIASPTFTGTVTFPSPFTLGSTSVTTTGNQLNFLNAAGSTTGSTSSNLVFSSNPGLSGIPTAPTAPLGTNTTQIATTAFVNRIAGGGVIFDTTVTTTDATPLTILTLSSATAGEADLYEVSAIGITTSNVGNMVNQVDYIYFGSNGGPTSLTGGTNTQHITHLGSLTTATFQIGLGSLGPPNLLPLQVKGQASTNIVWNIKIRLLARVPAGS